MCEQVLIQSMWSNCRSKICEVMSVTGIKHYSNADTNILVGVCVFSMLLHASLCLYFRILCQVKHLESSLLDSCIRCVLTTGNAPPGLGDRWHLGAHRGLTESLAGHDADPADLDFWTSLMSRAANVRCCCGTSESLPNLCDSFEDFGQLGMCSSCVFYR